MMPADEQQLPPVPDDQATRIAISRLLDERSSVLRWHHGDQWNELMQRREEWLRERVRD